MGRSVVFGYPEAASAPLLLPDPKPKPRNLRNKSERILLESTVKSMRENPGGGGSLSMFKHTSVKTLFSRPLERNTVETRCNPLLCGVSKHRSLFVSTIPISFETFIIFSPELICVFALADTSNWRCSSAGNHMTHKMQQGHWLVKRGCQKKKSFLPNRSIVWCGGLWSKLSWQEGEGVGVGASSTTTTQTDKTPEGRSSHEAQKWTHPFQWKHSGVTKIPSHFGTKDTVLPQITIVRSVVRSINLKQNKPYWTVMLLQVLNKADFETSWMLILPLHNLEGIL